MSGESGLSKPKLLSYVLLEKLVDFTFFVILFFIITAASTHIVENMLVISILAISVIVSLIFLYIRFNKLLLVFVKNVVPVSFFIRIDSLNTELLGGLYLFKTTRQVLRSGGYFLAAWSCIGIIFYLVSWPFLALLNLPVYAPLVLMVFSALSLAIPSAPSAIGTMHFAFLLAIKLMTGGNYDVDAAAGFIVVLHFLVILFDFIIGAMLLGTNFIRNRQGL